MGSDTDEYFGGEQPGADQTAEWYVCVLFVYNISDFSYLKREGALKSFLTKLVKKI